MNREHTEEMEKRMSKKTFILRYGRKTVIRQTESQAKELAVVCFDDVNVVCTTTFSAVLEHSLVSRKISSVVFLPTLNPEEEMICDFNQSRQDIFLQAKALLMLLEELMKASKEDEQDEEK